MIPRIAFTPGEPAGIGPELAVKIAQQPHKVQLVAVASKQLLEHTAAQLDLSLEVLPFDNSQAPKTNQAGQIFCLDCPLGTPVTPGALDVQNAAYVLETLTRAAKLCLDHHCQALVTGPVQKSIINESGLAFSGHTEFFADLSGTPKVVMMLATRRLRVALATTHLPLKDVSAAITRASLSEVIRILGDELNNKFGLRKPKILVCGLNPHAGEGGHLGMEEIDTIIPVLESFRDAPFELIGPLPADTLFTPPYLEQADAVLAMFHDQGLPVLKSHGFGEAVNITLGLPFIRTSVDHGTALNIAGQGKADIGSLEVALNYAYELSIASLTNSKG